MSDLPNPVPANSGATPTQPAQETSQATMQYSSVADSKVLQNQAVEQIESIIAQTASSPAERAENIHAVKAAYAKARFNIDVKGAL